jgi:DNA-binding GntR family transcriptional regulator
MSLISYMISNRMKASPNFPGIVLTLTKQQAVYQSLKDSILEGRLAPGQRLIIDDLAKEFGLSIIPVREALQLLQAERLVTIRPHAGASVSPITRESIEEVFAILEAMESITVRQIARHRPPGLEATLKSLLAKMDALEKRHSLEAWSALNMEFHLAMSSATAMPWVQEITIRTLSNWDRIRRHFFREGDAHPFATAQKEHHAIFRAIRKGDADQAEKLIRQHNHKAYRHYSLVDVANR